MMGRTAAAIANESRNTRNSARNCHNSSTTMAVPKTTVVYQASRFIQPPQTEQIGPEYYQGQWQWPQFYLQLDRFPPQKPSLYDARAAAGLELMLEFHSAAHSARPVLLGFLAPLPPVPQRSDEAK